jgi:hypothetical protein
MSKVVYGVFARSGAAEELAERLNQTSPAFAIAHAEGVREEEVQIPATLALRNGIVMSVVVGVSAALIAWLFVWPTQIGIYFPVSTMFLLALGGSLFGLVAGAVAGASECKPELAETAERATARGLTVVTAEVPNGDVDATVEAFERAGGVNVRAA